MRSDRFSIFILPLLPLLLLLSFEVIMKVDSQNNFVVSEISSISSSDAKKKKLLKSRFEDKSEKISKRKLEIFAQLDKSE